MFGTLDVETLQPTQIHVSDHLSQRDTDLGQPGTRLDRQSSVDVDDAVPVPHVHRQPGPMRRALGANSTCIVLAVAGV